MLPCCCRKLLLASLACVSGALAVLGLAFHLAEGDSPQVAPASPAATCPATDVLDCMACLHRVGALPKAQEACLCHVSKADAFHHVWACLLPPEQRLCFKC